MFYTVKREEVLVLILGGNQLYCIPILRQHQVEQLFVSFRKVVFNPGKNFSVTPAAWILCIRPQCQTRCNALLMSQKTALTSLPESRAMQKVLYRDVSWLTVESPEMKPDSMEVSKYFFFFVHVRD